MTYLDAQGGQEIENGVYETKTFSTGSLNFGLGFFTGSSYEVKVDADNNPRRVGNTIFFDVHALVPLDKLNFYVTDCTVTEDDTGNSYKIVADSCPDKYTRTKLESEFLTKTQIRFSYTGWFY